ncbi:MAG: hypothetical protein MUF49_25465 [Oculatellaceae cyanobacterium Prado106]|jgi:hypothetical protein|nr:hypothetical protein [Oculatellaceae cyanobacterium Prado106]
MPFTYNGVGTKYYGRRDVTSDGSYITTEWIVLAYIPIAPIGSFRVTPTGKSTHLIVFNSTEYFVTRVPLNWQQVRNVYTVGLVIFGAFFGFLSLINRGYSEPSPQLSSPSNVAPAAGK